VNQAYRSSTLDGVIPASLVGLLAAYVFADGVFLYLTPIQVGLYGLFGAALAAGAVHTVLTTALPNRVVSVVLVWLALACAWLLPQISGVNAYPRYIIGDFAGLLAPLLLLVVAFRFPRIFLSQRTIAVLTVAMFIAALLAVPLAETASRHEPPATLLVAALWSFFYLSGSKGLKRASAIALIATFGLALTSGERTAVLMWLALGSAGNLLVLRRLRSAIWLLAVWGLAVAVAVVMFSDLILVALLSTRLESLAQGELDTSLLNRVFEVRDVLSQWTLSNWFGFGHGATYLPDLSYPMRNLTDEGRVHHIHFGPVLLLYRYGVIAVVLFACLVFDLLRFLVLMNRIRYQSEQGLPAFFLGLALLGYLASFLMFNVFPDPAFSYTLAGYVYLRLTVSLPVFGTLQPYRPAQTAEAAIT